MVEREILVTVAGLDPGFLMIAWAIERTMKIHKIVDSVPVGLEPKLAMRTECLILRAARRHFDVIVIVK